MVNDKYNSITSKKLLFYLSQCLDELLGLMPMSKECTMSGCCLAVRAGRKLGYSFEKGLFHTDC